MRRRTFGTILFTGVLAAASPAAAQESWTVNGVVRAIRRDRQSLTIRHEAVPGLMGAMTMPFRVASLSLLDGLEVGQHIRFTLVRTPERRFEIRSIQRIPEPE